MKKYMMIALLMTIAIAANAMSRRDAYREARLVTDRMAVELRLTNRQCREVFDINLRFIDNPVAKDRALRHVLTARQFEKYMHMRHHGHHMLHGHGPAPKPHHAHHNGHAHPRGHHH